MPLDQDNILNLVIKASVFGIILSLWMFFVFLWVTRRLSKINMVEKRMGLGDQEDDGKTRVLRLWKDGQEATTVVPGYQRLSLLSRLDQLRIQAGWEISMPVVLACVVLLVTMVFVFTLLLTNSILAGLGVSVPLPLMFWIYLRGRISHQLSLFEGQLVEALELAARSLRAGHPLIGSFRLVSEEMSAPVNRIFAEICQIQALGVSLEEAVQKVAHSSASSDMRLFSTSVIIQLKSGGNLADMMQRLAFVIRDRMRLKRRVEVLTAQTQLSKRILIALPFVLFVVLNLLNPGYMAPLYSTTYGRMLMILAASGLLLGIWVMNRLAVLKY
ncbi:MAG: type II secretion system F family protein [Planctomycetota bacterium]|jgi:tight adherence protein B